MRLTLGFGLVLLPILLACGGMGGSSTSTTTEPDATATMPTSPNATAVADLDAATTKLDEAIGAAEAADPATLSPARLEAATERLRGVKDGLQPIAERAAAP